MRGFLLSEDGSPPAVRLERGSHGDRMYWHIHEDGVRRGYVFIERDSGGKPWLTIMVNKDSHGRGIGTDAYRLACQKSGYPEVYAHMRKSNAASRRAAEKAGFALVEDRPGQNGVTMVWRSGKE